MPKLVRPLSDIQPRTAKPKDKSYKLTDGGGLYLLVNPDGPKYWRMDYTYLGKRKTLAFGKYPEVTLADARDKRLNARRMLNEGVDPSQQKKDQERAAKDAAVHTFERIARDWHTNRLPTWKPSTARDTIRRLELDVFPEIGSMQIGAIKHQHFIPMLKNIEARGAHELAHRVKATCARVFSYARQQGIENYNPAADMKDVLAPVIPGHFAAISSDELPAFLKALSQNDARMFKETRIAVRLMLYTFLRTSELIETPWAEIDLEGGEWIVPWDRMKMGKRKLNPVKVDHHVCLSRQALELLRELHPLTGNSKYVFRNQRDPRTHMSNNTILSALESMGYKGKMTGHGFRALAMSTIKEQLGYRHEVVDRQLAHAPENKIVAAYDRATFLSERKKMMQDWADYLDAIEVGSLVPAKFGRAA